MSRAKSTTPGPRRPRKPSGKAELLVQLQQENDLLQAHLADVVATASTNEEIWRHFTEIERVLFRTRDLNRLAEEMLHEIKSRFKPDQVILFVSHPELLDRYFPNISRDCDPIEDGAWILPFTGEGAIAYTGAPPSPFLLTDDNVTLLHPFLPEEATQLRSGVLIPLCIHDLLFGLLLLGSLNAERYHPEAGTDLLEQLGIKIALCMDNCLSYEKVKDFTIQDPVTGLLNFFQIHAVLDKEFRKAKRSESTLSLLLVEPRFFHRLSDEEDLANGVLKHVANLLRDTLPQGESYIGRYGSDQFLVLLPNVNQEEAEEAVPYLSQVLRKAPFLYRNAAILIQTMVGIGTLTPQTKYAQSLIDAAYSELARLKTSLLQEVPE
jgi:diguanylate cyclase (GGDEF)-like protein